MLAAGSHFDNAAGDATSDGSAESMNCAPAHGWFRMILNVTGSMTWMSLTKLMYDVSDVVLRGHEYVCAHGGAPGSPERCRFRFSTTAFESYGVPSVNLMFGLIFTVHSVLSALAVTESAVSISYLLVAWLYRTRRS